MQELEDPFRSGEIAQRMLAQVAQAGSCREGVPGKVLGRQGEQHLAAVGRGQQASEAIEAGSQVVTITRFGSGGVQRHPNLERSDGFRPPLTHQRPLGIEGCGDRIGGRQEGSLDGIPNDLETGATVSLNRRVKEHKVACHDLGHRGAVSFPKRRAPLDIGEQKGDGAGGKIGHDPLQTRGWT
jgi:hypothetical protein